MVYSFVNGFMTKCYIPRVTQSEYDKSSLTRLTKIR